MFIFCQANIERLTSMEKLLCTTCSFDAARDSNLQDLRIGFGMVHV